MIPGPKSLGMSNSLVETPGSFCKDNVEGCVIFPMLDTFFQLSISSCTMLIFTPLTAAEKEFTFSHSCSEQELKSFIHKA